MPAQRNTRPARKASTPALDTLDAHLAHALDTAVAIAGDLDGAAALLEARLAALVADRAPRDELAALVAAADAMATATGDRGGVLRQQLADALADFRRAGGAR